MVSIDSKALEHACLCAGRSVHHFDRMGDDLPLRSSIAAHARAIEQHEAFKREVSDAVESLCNTVLMSHDHRQLREMLSHRFTIPKPDPDPLVEAVKACEYATLDAIEPEFAKSLRAALAARGYEVRKIEHTPPAGGSDASSS